MRSSEDSSSSRFDKNPSATKKHHVVLSYDSYDLPLRLRRLLDQVGKEIDGGLSCSAGAICTVLHEVGRPVLRERFLWPVIHECHSIEREYDFFRTLHVFRCSTVREK